MIDKRLIHIVGESKKYIAGNVAAQWASLAANIVLMMCVTRLLGAALAGTLTVRQSVLTAALAAAMVAARHAAALWQSRMAFLSSRAVKIRLRQRIYEKLLRLGSGYDRDTATSEIVQVSVEGVDQLKTYFEAYLPQFFYAMLAPLTLFVVLCPVSFWAALILFICVPLIPMTIVLVQRWAKKLLSKYWGEYTALGDTFLENLQGLTTLKIFQADEYKNEEMNRQAEKFRVITMQVLRMQLNSITIMDLLAYGGTALGIVIAAVQLAHGRITFDQALLILLLAADFFLPMRQLGSFFHVAMNGAAAADKIFRLLELPERAQGEGVPAPERRDIALRDVAFSYDGEREVLHGVSLEIPERGFVSLVGESGCGKSTVAALLTARARDWRGSITLGGVELSALREEDIRRSVTYVGYQSYLFKGTVEDNLRMGKPDAAEEELLAALEKTALREFFEGEQGLQTPLTENAANLSGGQRQRLALARALLRDTPVYIFDEATSNIDAESEECIMGQIRALAGERTVLLISHRLANVAASDRIYVMEKGAIAEHGTHAELLERRGLYERLWSAQQRLENYAIGGETA